MHYLFVLSNRSTLFEPTNYAIFWTWKSFHGLRECATAYSTELFTRIDQLKEECWLQLFHHVIFGLIQRPCMWSYSIMEHWLTHQSISNGNWLSITYVYQILWNLILFCLFVTCLVLFVCCCWSFKAKISLPDRYYFPAPGNEDNISLTSVKKL